jgi:putative phosphoribosyl transferase
VQYPGLLRPMLIEIPQLRDKVRVFDDRKDAGRHLAEMLSDYTGGSAIAIALPAGGVPVAGVIAEKLNLALDVAVVSKITLPWTTESGFGAVAFEGTVRLNERMLGSLGLTDEQVQQGIKLTTEKVAGRVRKLRKNKPMPDLSGKTAILVDDGIASGITMQTAVEAVQKLDPRCIIIAVPTAHSESLTQLLAMAETIYCANVRSGFCFAVADAYKNWYDVDEQEAAEILKRFDNV